MRTGRCTVQLVSSLPSFLRAAADHAPLCVVVACVRAAVLFLRHISHLVCLACSKAVLLRQSSVFSHTQFHDQLQHFGELCAVKLSNWTKPCVMRGEQVLCSSTEKSTPVAAYMAVTPGDGSSRQTSNPINDLLRIRDIEGLTKIAQGSQMQQRLLPKFKASIALGECPHQRMQGVCCVVYWQTRS